MPLERDCWEIVLYFVLKSMHRSLTDGSALDRPQYYEIILSLDTILTFSYTPLISEPIRKQNSKNAECIESVLKMSNAICALCKVSLNA